MDTQRLVRYARNGTARHQRDIPKRERPRRVIEPAKPFDPQLLGHAPRPAKRKGKVRR